ncbi:lymphocyte antigen 75-like isoform 1 [Aphelenchoides avenae]|nr:lymphocyte antigen 75-like isoform 1 [Aphelenchus avenae]
MVRFVAVLLLIALHVAFGKAPKCSRGSFPAKNPNICLKKGAAASWKDAAKGCVAHHGTLVSITEQNFIDFKPLLNFASGTLFWVGGANVGSEWKWSDGAPVNYAAWEKGQPAAGKDRCMAVNAANGQWRALHCSTSLPYICKVADNTPPAATKEDTDKGAKKPSNEDASKHVDKPTEQKPQDPSKPSNTAEGCSGDWVADKSGKTCLKLVKTAGSYEASRAECQKDGGDLASSGPFNDLLNGKEEGDYLIGLKYEPTWDSWRWPNGTEATATNWMHSLPNAYKSGLAGCVYAKHSKTPGFINEGKWANWFCEIEAFAICEKHL